MKFNHVCVCVCVCVCARVMDLHNREVMEMEDLLEQHLSEVHEDHQMKVLTTSESPLSSPLPLSPLSLSVCCVLQ